MSSNDGGRRRGILGLDLVRFAASCSVVMYHLAFWWWLPGSGQDAGREFHDGLAPLQEPFRWGWVGVQLFFTLSGFVIAFSANGKTAKTFIKGRIQRLYPAAWICATCTLLAVGWGAADALGAYLGSMTLWIYGPWVSGVYWTLSVEIAFYAVVACVLRFGGRLTPLGITLGLISTTYWVLRVADFASGEHGKQFFALVEGTQTGKLTLLSSGSYFGTGILLWSLAFEGASRRIMLLLGVFVAASLVALLGAGHYTLSAEGGAAWRVVEPPLIWFAGFACIASAIRWNDAVWARLGSHAAAIRTLGLLTYPLYLVHSEVGRDMMRATAALGAFPSLLLALALVLLIALAAVRLEQYPRRLLQWLFAIRSQPRALPLADLP